MHTKRTATTERKFLYPAICCCCLMLLAAMLIVRLVFEKGVHVVERVNQLEDLEEAARQRTLQQQKDSLESLREMNPPRHGLGGGAGHENKNSANWKRFDKSLETLFDDHVRVPTVSPQYRQLVRFSCAERARKQENERRAKKRKGTLLRGDAITIGDSSHHHHHRGNEDNTHSGSSNHNGDSGDDVAANQKNPTKHVLSHHHPLFPEGAPVPDAYRAPFYCKHSERQKEVVAAFQHGWFAYVNFAWGHDELLPGDGIKDWGVPVGKSFCDGKSGIGVTAIEAVSTLHLMNMSEEVDRVADYLESPEHTFDRDVVVGLFETTIRVLAGLLSGYDLTGEHIFLTKADDLGSRLLACFPSFAASSSSSSTKSDDHSAILPHTSINLKTREIHTENWHAESVRSLSDVGSIQLEFKKLAYFTGKAIYDRAATEIEETLLLKTLPKMKRHPRLFPGLVFADSAKPCPMLEVTLGARTDSFYEYVVKLFLLTNRTEPWLRDAWRVFRKEIRKYMVVSRPRDDEGRSRVFLSELLGSEIGALGAHVERGYLMDHLVCFAPGVFLLGSSSSSSSSSSIEQKEDFQLAAELARTCYSFYEATATGLAPEIVHFKEKNNNNNMNQPEQKSSSASSSSSSSVNDDIFILKREAFNAQRPEALEAQFYLSRFAHGEEAKREFRDNGYKIFQAMVTHLKDDVNGGFVGLRDVQNPNSEKIRKMESYFLSETLMYAFLLFAEEQDQSNSIVSHQQQQQLVPLDEFVFNTEGHPFRILPRPVAELIEDNRSRAMSSVFFLLFVTWVLLLLMLCSACYWMKNHQQAQQEKLD